MGLSARSDCPPFSFLPPSPSEKGCYFLSDLHRRGDTHGLVVLTASWARQTLPAHVRLIMRFDGD